MRAAFRPNEHVRRRADFELAYNTGNRAGGRFMTVFVRPTTEPVARLGIAATRKLGGSVVRSRAKRLVRELFRHDKPSQGLDVIVIPRREFLDASYTSLQREFSALVERAQKGGGHGAPRASRPRRPGADTRV